MLIYKFTTNVSVHAQEISGSHVVLNFGKLYLPNLAYGVIIWHTCYGKNTYPTSGKNKKYPRVLT